MSLLSIAYSLFPLETSAAWPPPTILGRFSAERAELESNTPINEINVSNNGPKATVALFAPLSDVIITGHESGKIARYDLKTGEELSSVNESHFGEIKDIQLSPDGTYFITSSKDKTAKVDYSSIHTSATLP